MIDDEDERQGTPPSKTPAPTTSAADEGENLASPSEALRREAQARQAAEGDSEELLWQGGYSAKAMVGTWVLCGVLTVAAIVLTAMFEQVPWIATLIAIVLIWAIVLLVYATRRLGMHYQLTTQRFIHQSGILSRRTDRIEVIDIDDVSYEQGPVQRMFGIGSIRIDSSDRSHPVLTMQGISAVHDVAGLIDDIRRKERRRRSLHIESV